MKGKRYTEPQILENLGQVDPGQLLAGFCQVIR